MAISISDHIMWTKTRRTRSKKKSLNLYRESIGSQDFASTGKHFQKQLKITVQAS